MESLQASSLQDGRARLLSCFLSIFPFSFPFFARVRLEVLEAVWWCQQQQQQQRQRQQPRAIIRYNGSPFNPLGPIRLSLALSSSSSSRRRRRRRRRLAVDLSEQRPIFFLPSLILCNRERERERKTKEAPSLLCPKGIPRVDVSETKKKITLA